ncbi:choice-of-anchor B family protein [uncultured Dokdonia sp.]|uniref:choice-of-anchor B family protein n=1 Tax=uncultured Dokdonia sp. TaxID=575653 RepID=UPI00262E1A35|nr:choice-of-anchor B family protein [uncultured Dokdonia sp.]
MKSYITKICVLFGLLQFSTMMIAQTPCTGNMAGGFPCEGYDLQDRLTTAEMDSSFANDSWGWTDPEDGTEYALIGLTNGTAFVDISDPTNVIYLGKLPTHTGNSTWRDIKVYQNHAFVVSEASGHGMQVFDLTQLRDVTNPPVTFSETAHYDGFGNAHNIVINVDSGYAYGVGTQTFSGGPHFINIQDPTNPIGEGGYAANSYSHDAQVVTYNGPDADYTGREILIGSNENEIAIVDITDKNNPVEISTSSYPNIGYTHQGWFTEDQRYFLLGDEIDEINVGFNTRTIVFDLEDLDNPQLHLEYEGTNSSTDHNGYVVGNLYYLASYRAGMRVIDISDIANQNMTEIGYFDTVPSSDNVGTTGLWNVYPFFESGNIVLSGNNGFTLVKQNEALSVTSFEVSNETSMFPNPSSGIIDINASASIGAVTIYNTMGQVVHKTGSNTNHIQVDLTHLQTGLYFVKTNNSTQKLLLK